MFSQHRELQLENEKLKFEIENLKLKLDHLKEKNTLLEEQLRESKQLSSTKLQEENRALKHEMDVLKFKVENDTENIELETENKKLKSEIEIQTAENNHLKELIDTYRAMPDVKNMIDNLQNLAVPNIEQLKEFSRIVSNSKIEELKDKLENTTQLIVDSNHDTKKLLHETFYAMRYGR